VLGKEVVWEGYVFGSNVDVGAGWHLKEDRCQVGYNRQCLRVRVGKSFQKGCKRVRVGLVCLVDAFECGKGSRMEMSEEEKHIFYWRLGIVFISLLWPMFDLEHDPVCIGERREKGRFGRRICKVGIN